MPTDNAALVAALLAQMAEMQKQIAALTAPPAPAPVPVPVAPVAVHVAMPAAAPASVYFTDANGVEWIDEGIRRWNYGIDQAKLMPPVPLPAPGHNGWWNSGDPYKYQQRDPAFLNAEMKRIRDQWAASRPPAPPPKVYPPGSRG